MANTVLSKTFFGGVGAACIEFDIDRMLAQGNAVCDLFVGTGSMSPVILATGGAIDGGTVSPWHATRHSGNILCQPYEQGGDIGIRVRINFVGDKPQEHTTQRLTLLQVGATKFDAPEHADGTPR